MRRNRLITLTIALLVAVSTLGALPASAASNPFGTGLGGNRAAFEAKYGKPVDDSGAKEFGIGTRYAIPGYKAVYVFWHKDVAVHLVLVANQGWTGEKSVDLALRFLPTDAVFQKKNVGTGDNARGQAWAFANGHSSALSKRLSANTYRQYQAGAPRGTCGSP